MIYPELAAVVGTNVPNYLSMFLQGGQGSNIGKYIEPGIPNIWGMLGVIMLKSSGAINGVFSKTGRPWASGSKFVDYEQGTVVNAWFDAAACNPNIYGKSNGVQPPARIVKYLIRAKD